MRYATLGYDTVEIEDGLKTGIYIFFIPLSQGLPPMLINGLTLLLLALKTLEKVSEQRNFLKSS